MTDTPQVIYAESKTWIQKHQVLIIAVLVLAITGWLVQKLLNHISDVDHDKAVATQTILQQQAQQNAQQAELVKQEFASVQQMFLQMSAQNAQLATAIASRNQQVVVQQKTDAALPPTQLAARWDSLLGTTGQVQSTPSGYVVTPTAAVLTTQKLEEVPVLQMNVADLSTQNTNKDHIITDGKKLVEDQQSQIGGLKTQIVEADKACKAEITSVKADARKSKFKLFGIGYVAGLVSGLLVHTLL